MHRLLRLATVATVLAPGAPAVLAGQIRIDGQVIDNQTLRPIDGAEVRISRVGRWEVDRLFTDELGRFSFEVEEDGGYVFRAARIGYEEAETPILWTDGYRVYDLEIRLDAGAVLLAPIEVRARSQRYRSPVLSNFRARLESGPGHYITRDDIDRIKPARVSDLLVRVPGVHLRSSGAGLQRVLTMGRVGGGACPAEIFVDGLRWTLDLPDGTGQAGFTVDDAVRPASVIGIEVYRGLATVPPEFLTPRSRCGVVAIWTRREGG